MVSRLVAMGRHDALVEASEDRYFWRREENLRLREREFRLFRQKVYLALTVVLVTVAVVFTVLGVHSTVSWVAGGSGLASVLAAIFDGRRGKPDLDD